MKFFLMAVTVFLGLINGAAADESVYDSEITYISSSPAQCGGDAFIKLKPAHPSCVFAYVKSTEPSYSQTYSMLFSAFMAGKKVHVSVATGTNTDNNTCWSSAPVCKIKSVSMCTPDCNQ